MKLKIMTFNIQHGVNHNESLKGNKDVIELEKDAAHINNYDCDIIGLNEVRGAGEDSKYTDQAKTLGEFTNREYFFGKAIDIRDCGPYGNAFLSRFPVKSTEIIPIPDPEIKEEGRYYETRSIIKAVVDAGKDVTVFISHFGLVPSEQKNAVEALITEAKKVNTPVIFMGDLNMRPDNEILKPLYEEFNEAFEENNQNTFPSHEPSRKIDYIFLSKDIKLQSAEVIKKVVSDHCALIAEIEL